MPENTPPTIEEIRATIRSAKDSVWVITDSIEKLTNGATPNEQIRGNIDRNVSHLKLVTSSADVLSSGEDISELLDGIAAGEAKLAENIW